jgi:hypothetical protein
LSRTKTITGRSIAEITEIGRPERSSGAGFMGQDEDIISVLRGDNRLVAQLGSTHPQMAEPLFHVFNMILTVKKDSGRGNMGGMLYNQKKIDLKSWGAKGWQDSIFNDEVLGYWEIEIWREPDQEERAFLSHKYANLTDEEMARLISKLSHIHTGEMVPYYIMRYGFYEGHTDYRTDPVAVSFIFGLKSLEEIESAFPGKIYETLMSHFTRDNTLTPTLESVLDDYLAALGGRDALALVFLTRSAQDSWSGPIRTRIRIGYPSPQRSLPVRETDGA